MRIIPRSHEPSSITPLRMKCASIALACLAMVCSPSYAAKKVEQTRIAWLGSCPSDPEPVVETESFRSGALGLITAAMVPKLVDGAVDIVAESLKAAGQTKTVSSTAAVGDYFYKVSQEADLSVVVNCLVVVRGEFDDKGQTTHALAEKSDEFTGLQKASFHLEAKLKPLPGLQFFQLVPQYLHVTKFDQSGFMGAKQRDYVAAINLTLPGATSPFGSAEMTFKNVRVGDPIKRGDWRLHSAKTFPIPFPAESSDTTKTKEKREGQIAPYLLAVDTLTPPKAAPFGPAPNVYADPAVGKSAKAYCDALSAHNKQLEKGSREKDDRCKFQINAARDVLETDINRASRSGLRVAWARNVCTYKKAGEVANKSAHCSNQPTDPKRETETFTYFTTQLALSETREGSKFALYLGTALSGSKEAVSAELQKKYVPKSSEVKEAEEKAEIAAMDATYIADLEVIRAQEALAHELIQDPPVPVDVTDARIALLKAKIAANDAYRKSGRAIPFRNLTDV